MADKALAAPRSVADPTTANMRNLPIIPKNSDESKNSAPTEVTEPPSKDHKSKGAKKRKADHEEDGYGAKH